MALQTYVLNGDVINLALYIKRAPAFKDSSSMPYSLVLYSYIQQY